MSPTTPVSSLGSSVSRKLTCSVHSLSRASVKCFAYSPLWFCFSPANICNNSVCTKYFSFLNLSLNQFLNSQTFILPHNIVVEFPFMLYNIGVQNNLMDLFEDCSQTKVEDEYNLPQFLLNFNAPLLLYSRAEQKDHEISQDLFCSYPRIDTPPNLRVGPANNFVGQPMWFYRRKSVLIAVAANAIPTLGEIAGEVKITTNIPCLRPVLKRKRLERFIRKNNPLVKFDWLNISPRMTVIETIQQDFPKVFKKMRKSSSSKTSTSQSSTNSSKIQNSKESIILISPRNVNNSPTLNILHQ